MMDVSAVRAPDGATINSMIAKNERKMPDIMKRFIMPA
jgi:hypothetical protein